MPDRYTTPESSELQPGSTDVLRNKLGIVDTKAMDVAEAVALKKAEDIFFRHFDAEHRFTANDICWMHQQWLGEIYHWAGKYRSVDISKGGFMFAHAAHIALLMNDFERLVLSQQTMSTSSSHSKSAHALAVVHAELILIHPFREGNGRLARSLSNLMAVQGNLPPLRYDRMDENKEYYFAAIGAAVSQDFEPLTKLFLEIINDSEKH